MDARLYGVYEAGSRMFIEKGFKATQVGDISKAAGIATGSMYKLFDSKLACLHFCLMTAFAGGQVEETELPFRELSEGELMRGLISWGEKYFDIYRGISTRMPFEEMVPAVYDGMVRYRMAICLLEGCGDPLGEVAGEYWRQRQTLFELFEKELHAYMDCGQMRRISYLRHLVYSFVSMLADWALHTYYDSGKEPIDEPTARAIALDLTLHAFAAEEGN